MSNEIPIQRYRKVNITILAKCLFYLELGTSYVRYIRRALGSLRITDVKLRYERPETLFLHQLLLLP
jgi:uncharacterized membrane protein